MWYFVEDDKILARIEKIDEKYFFIILTELQIDQTRKELLQEIQKDFEKDSFDFNEYRKYFLNDFQFVEK